MRELKPYSPAKRDQRQNVASREGHEGLLRSGGEP